MSIVPASLKDHVRSFVDGLLGSLGESSAALKITRHADGRGVALVRDGYRVSEFPAPLANRRIHQIEDVASLAAWLVRHGKGGASVEVFVGAERIVAALDPMSVDGDVVVSPLAEHPRWARWSEILDQPVGQKALWRLLISAAEDFPPIAIEGSRTGATASEGERIAFDVSKLSAVKNVECSVEIDERGMTTFASANEKTTISGKIPPKFRLRLPLLIGVTDAAGEEIAYDVDVHVEVNPAEKGPPSFTLRCPSLPVLTRAARLDAASCLGRLLGDGFLVGAGEYGVATRPVRDWSI